MPPNSRFSSGNVEKLPPRNTDSNQVDLSPSAIRDGYDVKMRPVRGHALPSAAYFQIRRGNALSTLPKLTNSKSNGDEAEDGGDGTKEVPDRPLKPISWGRCC